MAVDQRKEQLRLDLSADRIVDLVQLSYGGQESRDRVDDPIQARFQR